MTGCKITQERIAPEEAMKLFAFASMEEMDRVKALYDTYRESKEVRYPEIWDLLDLWDLMSLLSFVYDTGRVQGIRQERAKSIDNKHNEKIAV